MAVEVISQIQIKNNSTLAVVDQSRVAGGMGWVVADLPARNAIPASSRATSMEVKVIDAGGAGTKYYSLDATLAVWTEIVSTGFIPTSEKGAANGVATLDANGYIPATQIRNLFLNDSAIYASEAAMLAATTTTGNFGIRTDTGAVWIKLNNNGPPSLIGDWSVLSSPGVATINGLTGGVSIDFDTLLTWGASATQFETGITNSAYIAGIDGAISTLQGQVGAGKDTDAIHDNVSGEINIVASKATPVGADLILIEDSASSFVKKKILVSTLSAAIPAGTVEGALQLRNAAGTLFAADDRLLFTDNATVKRLTLRDYATSGKIEFDINNTSANIKTYSNTGVLTTSLAGFGTSGSIACFNAGVLVMYFSIGSQTIFNNPGFPFGIGTGAPNVQTALDVVGTNSMKIPIGTTAQRPGTPVAGMVRYNSTVNKLEFYNGSGWETVTSA